MTKRESRQNHWEWAYAEFNTKIESKLFYTCIVNAVLCLTTTVKYLSHIWCETSLLVESRLARQRSSRPLRTDSSLPSFLVDVASFPNPYSKILLESQKWQSRASSGHWENFFFNWNDKSARIIVVCKGKCFCIQVSLKNFYQSLNLLETYNRLMDWICDDEDWKSWDGRGWFTAVGGKSISSNIRPGWVFSIGLTTLHASRLPFPGNIPFSTLCRQWTGRTTVRLWGSKIATT